MRALKSYLAALLISFLGGCGVHNHSQSLATGSGLNCSERARILLAGETAEAKWVRDTFDGAVDKSIEVGDSLTYLDWGSLSNLSELAATYTAPSFVPESRKIDVVASAGGVSRGACPVYLLQTGSLGFPDDGSAVALPVQVYSFSSAPTEIPNFSTLTPINKSMVRNLNWNNSTFPGVTDSTTNLGFWIKGVVTVDTANTYRFFIQVNSGRKAKLKVNGSEVSASGNKVFVEVPLSAPGRYPFEISVITSTALTLRFSSAAKAANGSFPTDVVIPYSALDRQ